MGGKKLISGGLMLIGMMHMPFALYLGITQGMGPEMSTFFMGLLLFWCGWYLQRVFGE